MMPKIRFQLAIATLAALATTTLFAARYWQGQNTTEKLFSQTDNWSTDSGGTTGNAGGATIPSSADSTGSTQFRYWHSGIAVFDRFAVLGGAVRVDTAYEEYFVWDATDPSYGFAASGQEFNIAQDKSPSYLRIDGGTYTSAVMNVTYNSNMRGGLDLNGGSLAVTKFRVGRNAGADATLKVSDGTLTCTSTGASYVSYANGATGTVFLTEGTIDMSSSSLYVGGYSDSLANVNVSGGRLEPQEVRHRRRRAERQRQ